MCISVLNHRLGAKTGDHLTPMGLSFEREVGAEEGKPMVWLMIMSVAIFSNSKSGVDKEVGETLI